MRNADDDRRSQRSVCDSEKRERPTLVPDIFEEVGTPMAVVAELAQADAAGYEFVSRTAVTFDAELVDRGALEPSELLTG